VDASGQNDAGLVRRGRSAIVAAGTYLPAFHIEVGRRRVIVSNGDEDVVTLAVEAALACLAGVCEFGQVEELHLAMGRPDLVDGPQAEVVREALGLAPRVLTRVSADDALAGLSAIIGAQDAVAAGRLHAVLVVAVEPGDGATVHAGAVAVLVASAPDQDGGGALLVSHPSGAADTGYGTWTDAHGERHGGDPRYVEHRMLTLAGQALNGSGPVSVVSGPAATAVARQFGADGVVALPDHGVAGPLLGLLAAAGTGQDTVGMLAAAPGRVVALQVKVGRGAPRWTRCARQGSRPPLDPESSPPLSLPGSSPFFRRGAGELLRLEAARCRGCGEIVYPPSQRPICASCLGTDFEPWPLARAGRVHSFVVNRFLPSGFGAEMALVLADLDDGARYWAPTSGIPTSELAIGAPVWLRRFTSHNGGPVYAMKFLSPDHDRTDHDSTDHDSTDHDSAVRGAGPRPRIDPTDMSQKVAR
jgi:uncharacterized OB-fold protein